MIAQQSNRTRRGKLKLYQTFIHPEVQKRLKLAAIEDDMSIPDKLHEILCRALGLTDLLDGGKATR